MSKRSFVLNAELLSRLALMVPAALLILLVVLTAFNVAVRIPDEAETDAFGDPADTFLDEEWGTYMEETDEEEPRGDGVTLTRTEDAGMEYQDSLIFVGDATTANLINKGVLTGGTNTRQVWRSESNVFNLNAEVTSTKIIFPGTGEPLTVAEAAKAAKPAVLIITLGGDWGVSYLSEEDFKSCYDKLVKAVQKASPKTTVVLQSIFPVAASCPSLDNSRIDTANEWVKEVAAANECYYLDTQSILKDDNSCLMAEYCASADGIRLEKVAYEAILTYIRTHAVPD